jgi:predicted nucleic acid-binding Zn ribbon protein
VNAQEPGAAARPCDNRRPHSTLTCEECGGPLPPRHRVTCSDRCYRAYRRETRYTETSEFGAVVVRMIQTLGRRVGAYDLAMFGAVWTAMDAAEAATCQAIDDLRAADCSWAEIAREIGRDRQAVQQWRARRTSRPGSDHGFDVNDPLTSERPA